MKFSEKFYAILKEKSQERGWQKSFSASAGISQNALSKIISGKTKSPEIKSVSAIIDALGGILVFPGEDTQCVNMDTEQLKKRIKIVEDENTKLKEGNLKKEGKIELLTDQLNEARAQMLKQAGCARPDQPSSFNGDDNKGKTLKVV